MNKLFYNPIIAFVSVCLFVPVIVDAAPLLWSCDCDGYLGTVDVASGDVHVIGNMGVIIFDIAFDKYGDLYGVYADRFYKIDPLTAATTLIGYMGTGVNSLACDHSGILYIANSSLYTVDPATGSTRLVGRGGAPYDSDGDLAAGNGFLFLASNFGGSNLVRIDPRDGSGTRIGGTGFPYVFGLECLDGTTLYGLSGTRIIKIDPCTGTGTPILDYSGRGLGISNGCAYYPEPLSVPIPATVRLIISCLLAILIIVKYNCQLPRFKVSEQK